MRIVYLSWPAAEIAGGIKIAFRHVEALREAGVEAVVATADAEPPGWFQTTAPTIALSAVSRGEDVLVFPENHHGLLKTFGGWPNRKVVFCQNQFMVFRGLGGCRSYADFGVSGLLCAGQAAADYCRMRFPDTPIEVVPVCVDQELFHFQREKKLQIAYAPRKRTMEAGFIRDLFLARNPDFSSVPWIEIRAATETQLAAVLRETAVYLALCRFEACPLTILESLLCGCITAGFTGLGGREYTTERNGFWAEEDDCVGCAEQLARAVRLVERGGAMYRDMLEAANLTARQYSRQALAKRLAAFWHAFLASGTFPEEGRREAAATFRAALPVKPDRSAEVPADRDACDQAVGRLPAGSSAGADLAAAQHESGLAWLAKRDLPRAVASYREAVRIRPDFAEAHSNLGMALLALGDTAAALDSFHAALRIKPDFAPAHLNRAAAWLRAGKWHEGCQEFEWRRLCEPYRLDLPATPLWDGSPGANRCLLLCAEGGAGDTIQFVRYAPLVRARCGSVILQCQAPLAPLLARAAGIDRLIAGGEPLPEHHAHAPLMSLPLMLGSTPETIPAKAPYLFADSALIQTWQGRLAAYNGFKVGISWQGNPSYAVDRLRSVPLERFAALAGVPGVTLFSLQKGCGTEQLAAAGPALGVVDLGPGFDVAAGAFMDTAAVMRSLDLVVTSDTAIAHLAGALGVPVWVALSTCADWRWLEERADSPWYPTMRLFRQSRPGDWEELFGRIAAELAAVSSGEGN